MPKFMDHHPMPDLPPEALSMIEGRLREGKADEFGVTGLNVYLGKQGQAYCVTEAPDAEAVVRSHEANGVPLDRHDVVEVESVV
jgi:uncharacterized protein DUF4242